MIRRWLQYAKNYPGWSSKERYLVISCDDFGAVRLANKTAREYLQQQGLPMNLYHYDQYDILESAEDLNILAETLSSVKDSNGKSAVITGFGMAANIDFAAMKANGYTEFINETVDKTFDRLGMQDAWKMLQSMQAEGLLAMEFHGREHVHVGWLMQRLQEKHPQVLANMEVESLAGLENAGTKHIDYTAAFAYDSSDEFPQLAEILADGIALFEQVWGVKPVHFTPPVMKYSRQLDEVLVGNGIQYLDRVFQNLEYLGYEEAGKGKHKKRFHWQNQTLKTKNNIPESWGVKAAKGELHAMIRNCFFEPMWNPQLDWVNNTMAQIEAAFAMGKPANLATHRVSFVGGIEKEVRDRGNQDLKNLLVAVKKRWPQVQFVSTRELGEIMRSKK